MEIHYPNLPVEITEVVQSLLASLDQHMPERIEGFYLVGSIALNDYRIGQSDIDFVAVTSADNDMSPLPGIHAELAMAYSHVHCDGIYLRKGELAHPPQGLGPSAREGVVTLASIDERHPVTWLTLLHHGMVLRGEAPDASWIAADASEAANYSRENLQAYWGSWLDRLRKQVGNSSPRQGDWMTVWGALGVARLHAMIETGRVLSKTDAGRYALSAFPEHSLIISEALRLREGRGTTSYNSPELRNRDLIAFLGAVIGYRTRSG